MKEVEKMVWRPCPRRRTSSSRPRRPQNNLPAESSDLEIPLRGRTIRVVDWTKNHWGEAWPKGDLFFLTDVLARGMSNTEVAAFLGRTEDEVRGQSEALKLPRRPPAQDS
jgi:hypothetical protein